MVDTLISNIYLLPDMSLDHLQPYPAHVTFTSNPYPSQTQTRPSPTFTHVRHPHLQSLPMSYTPISNLYLCLTFSFPTSTHAKHSHLQPLPVSDTLTASPCSRQTGSSPTSAAVIHSYFQPLPTSDSLTCNIYLCQTRLSPPTLTHIRHSQLQLLPVSDTLDHLEPLPESDPPPSFSHPSQSHLQLLLVSDTPDSDPYRCHSHLHLNAKHSFLRPILMLNMFNPAAYARHPHLVMYLFWQPFYSVSQP